MGTRHATVKFMRRSPIRLAAVAVLALCGSASLADHYSLPLLVAPTAGSAAQGVLRILNGTEESGSVEIYAIDDAGMRTGPASFTLNAWTAVELDASDLANGNAMKGLSTGLGTLSGDVRLEIETDLQIVPSAYVRAADGTLSVMHDTVRAGVAAGGGGGYRYLVPIFNAASEVTQVSRLRLINPGDEPAAITIEGRDDTGAAATGGTVQLTLPAGGARTLTAQQLEAGENGVMGQTSQSGEGGGSGVMGQASQSAGAAQPALTGRLGAGVGRWRLSLSSDRPVQVVNVVSATSGYLNNLSTTGVPGAAPVDQEAFSERYGAGGIEYRRGHERYTLTTPAADRFTQTGESGGVPYTLMGSYRYEAVRPDAGLVTLLYDDGDVCRVNLYFESRSDGRFASRCTGSGNPDGIWSGGIWAMVAGGETMPEEPDGMAQEGDCYPGQMVRSGESCTYPGTTDEFTINERGRGQFLGRLAGIRIRFNEEMINGRVYDFEASHQGDGVWRIDRVAGMTEAPTFGSSANPGDRTYMAGTAIEPLTLPEATGGGGRLTYSLSPDVPGLSFIASMRQLTGTPTAAGAYDMTYTVTDADGDTDTLDFTITVEQAEDMQGGGEGENQGGGEGDGEGENQGDGDGEVEDDSSISIARTSCTGVRTGPTTVLMALIGYVEAQRAVSGVRVVGFAGGLLVGAQFLGDIPAGGTRNFAISGEITFTGSSLNCISRVYSLLAAPTGGAESTGVVLEVQL